MSLKQNDVVVENIKENEIETCKQVTCEHGTLYENTCSLCWEKAKEDNDLAIFEDLHQQGIL